MQINHRFSYIFIFLIVFSFIGGGWYFYTQVFKDIENPYKLIPPDAALIIEIPRMQQLHQQWKKESVFEKSLKELPGFKAFQEVFPALFESFQQISSSYSSWEGRSVVISAHSKGLLFILPGSDLSLLDFNREEIQNWTTELEIAEKTLNGDLYLELKGGSGSLFLMEKRGLFILTNEIELLESSTHQIKSPSSLLQSPSFSKLQKVSGKRSDAHVYVNYKNLSKIVDITDQSSLFWHQPEKIASWSGMDLSLKENEILLNGYSIPSDTGSQFLKLLKNQESVGMSICDHFPFETRAYTHLSLSHYEDYFEAWTSYLKTTDQWDQYKSDFMLVDKALKSENADVHQSWWAGEMAFLVTEDGKEYAVFLAQKERDSFRKLSNIAHLSQPSMITTEYKDYKIKEINFPHFLFTQFGPWFNTFNKSYFTIVDELVIFAKSIPDLKIYIDLLESGSILQKNQNYSSFSDNLSKSISFTFYVNRPESPRQLISFVSDEMNNELKKTSLFKKDLSGYSLQLDWKNDMVYTGIFAGLSGITKQKLSNWQVILDSPISDGPFKVTDHTDGSHKYLVFDEYRQAYLLNEQGDIVWKKSLKEKPISQVYEVDYYQNGKIQYLFNSENYMYLMDLTGAFVENYPIQLNSEASAGLSLIDYSHNKDYRIFISGKNGEIYNYKKDGSLLKDWNSKNTRRDIVKPISHVVANSKDYLIAEAKNGNVIMYNRQGKVRMEIRKSFTNALGSDLYANRTNSKGMMITTNQEGKLMYIPEKGDVRSTDFGEFSKDHFFIYADFTGNGYDDFIYLDGKELQVFDRFKKSVLSYVFANNITTKPKIFTLAGRKILGVLDKPAGKLFLFNSDGLISNKIEGETDFELDVLKNGQVVIIIGREKALKMVPLK